LYGCVVDGVDAGLEVGTVVGVDLAWMSVFFVGVYVGLDVGSLVVVITGTHVGMDVVVGGVDVGLKVGAGRCYHRNRHWHGCLRWWRLRLAKSRNTDIGTFVGIDRVVEVGTLVGVDTGNWSACQCH